MVHMHLRDFFPKRTHLLPWVIAFFAHLGVIILSFSYLEPQTAHAWGKASFVSATLIGFFGGYRVWSAPSLALAIFTMSTQAPLTEISLATTLAGAQALAGAYLRHRTRHTPRKRAHVTTLDIAPTHTHEAATYVSKTDETRTYVRLSSLIALVRGTTEHALYCGNHTLKVDVPESDIVLFTDETKAEHALASLIRTTALSMHKPGVIILGAHIKDRSAHISIRADLENDAVQKSTSVLEIPTVGMPLSSLS
jgi:hypothetical protein